jgi:hypothetical protein
MPIKSVRGWWIDPKVTTEQIGITDYKPHFTLSTVHLQRLIR